MFILAQYTLLTLGGKDRQMKGMFYKNESAARKRTFSSKKKKKKKVFRGHHLFLCLEEK